MAQIMKQFTALRELKKVCCTSDVIFEILDARNPVRAGAIEEAVKRENATSSKSVKLVLVLNKIDLVPIESVVGWLEVFRKEYPTVAFKCNTTVLGGEEKPGLGVEELREFVKSFVVSDSPPSKSLPPPCTPRPLTFPLNTINNTTPPLTNTIKKIINNTHRQNKHIIILQDADTTPLTIGIIGYPNVGKSSLINTLKLSPPFASVSPTPGQTTALQQLTLGNLPSLPPASIINLLDSPGIVFADPHHRYQAASLNLTADLGTHLEPSSVIPSGNSSTALLRNTIDPDNSTNAEALGAVSELLLRCDRVALATVYGLEEGWSGMGGGTTLASELVERDGFLDGVVKKMGGGDRVGAARAGENFFFITITYVGDIFSSQNSTQS